MKPVSAVCLRLQGRMVVSCQAPEGSVFGGPDSMARFAVAAVEGGAAGIRANGSEDVRAIRAAAPAVPIIGIHKSVQADGKVLITSSFEDARELVRAGADLIALDCTARGQAYGAFRRLRRIQQELRVPVMADIATLEEALAACAAGADLVATTLRGYTPDTEHIRAFQPSFVADLARALDVGVVAEGRIDTPAQAREAFSAGAVTVVVGTAITCPEEITRRFVQAIEIHRPATLAQQYFVGIDLGATATKSGTVSSAGELIGADVEATPARAGRTVLLEHLKTVARRGVERARGAGLPAAALGVATPGWVDAATGRVAYATDNLPGWTGTAIAEELEAELGLPVAVENDANALAVAEKHFGLARNVEDFVCVTLGTGVGGGCYVAGRLNRGAHFFANALGHLPVERDGLPCTCGLRGCLEVYTNSAALLRYAREQFLDAEQLIAAANGGDAAAGEAIRMQAAYLAVGLASIVHLLDPEMVIISGGLAQNNPLLLCTLEQELRARTTVWAQRRLQIRVSELGYHGGVFGAAAVAKRRVGARA